jgi:hypothetical protein
MEASPSPQASWDWATTSKLVPGKAAAATPMLWKPAYTPHSKPKSKSSKTKQAAEQKELERLGAEQFQASQAERTRTQETLSAITEELANEKKMRADLHKKLAEAKTDQEPTPLF